MTTRSALVVAALVGILLVTIVAASLLPPQRFYPAIDIEAGSVGTTPVRVQFLFASRTDLGECERLAAAVARHGLANCPQCRIARLDCTSVLTAEQARLLGHAPMPVPTGRMANGAMLFSVADPAFALASCLEAEAQSAHSANPVKCIPAHTERPPLPVPSVASGWSAALFLVALFSAWFVCWLIVRYDHLHSHFSHDPTHGGPQKYHVHPTPRIGGIAILAGLVCAGGAMLIPVAPGDAKAYGLLLLASMPAFLGGLTEDATKKVGVLERLLLTMISGALAAWLLGAVLVRLDLPLVDQALIWLPFAVVFTTFAVGGIANAINIIDGYNGLASGFSVIALAALAIIARTWGDMLVFSAALALAGSLLGFMAWNWPRGKIFLGDGGAYLVGFLLAELSILLVLRNPGVSVWFPLVLLIYPVFETLYSIYRRKLGCNSSPGQPDSRHLHHLIHDKLIPVPVGRHRRFSRNSRVAKYFWVSSAACALLGIVFSGSTPALMSIATGYCFFYTVSYRWLENRDQRHASPDAQRKL